MNEWKWYVVDPSAVNPEVVRERWEADYARTNSPRWRRTVARFVPWAVFVIASLIWVLVATWIDFAVVTPNRPALFGAAIIAGIIVSTLLGIGSAMVLQPKAVWPGERHHQVIGVPSTVEHWAPEDISLDDLWALARQYDRVEQVTEYYEEPYLHLHPPWFAPEFEAFFHGLAATEFAALETVAARLDFPIPAELTPRGISKVLTPKDPAPEPASE